MNPCPICSQLAEGQGPEGVRRPIPDLADGGNFITLTAVPEPGRRPIPDLADGGNFITLTAVPEPGTMSLLGLAFGSYVFRRLRKRRAA